MSETPKKAPFTMPTSPSDAMSRARDWFSALTAARKVVLFSAVGLAVVALVILPRLFAEPYAPLFTQLDAAENGTIVAKLKELKIPYRVAESGNSIEVPEKRREEVRMELAGQGLPRGGGVGFEAFDKMRLGATDFEQRIMYRRALEGELTRTIGNLGAVQSARVHLVLPEKSVFVSKTEPASASIVVKLRPGKSLGPSEVTGIVHLTASSAPGLAPEHVTLLSADGAVLHRARREGADGQDLDEGSAGQARNIEAQLEERARTMIERIVGPGHADVRVAAELDHARVERTEDRFDPTKSVLRSEERSVERAGVADTVAGVPGAEANLPGAVGAAAAAALASAKPASSAAPAASGSAAASATPAPAVAPAMAANTAGTVRESHTRNFEIDRVTEKRVMAGGGLKRLTVAVVVDGAPGANGALAPRSKEELEKIAALVRSAVGIHDARGDSLTVESAVFAPLIEPTIAAATEPTTSKTPQIPAFLKTRNGMIGAGVVGFFLLLTVLRAMRKRAKNAEATKVIEIPTPILSDGAAAAAANALPAASEVIGDPRAAAQERALRDPATAALVLRAWLGSELS